MKPARPPDLFAAAEIERLEAERERLSAALARMRAERRYGAVQRTEWRLRDISSRVLRISQGKEEVRP